MTPDRPTQDLPAEIVEDLLQSLQSSNSILYSSLQASNQTIQNWFTAFVDATNQLALTHSALAMSKTNLFWVLEDHFALATNIPASVSNSVRQQLFRYRAAAVSQQANAARYLHVAYVLLNNNRLKIEAAAAAVAAAAAPVEEPK